jgi:hypothetical protein
MDEDSNVVDSVDSLDVANQRIRFPQQSQFGIGKLGLSEAEVEGLRLIIEEMYRRF